MADLAEPLPVLVIGAILGVPESEPITIRSPDAIHLGTALSIRRNLTSFVTYDKRLLDAATAAGLIADSPA